VRVADHSRDEAADGLDHRHHRDLSPVEDIVAETDQPHASPSRRVVEHALVDTFIPAAPEDEMLFRRELPSHSLGEHLASGRRENDERTVGGNLG
jgi:hypothetical protein